MTEPRPKAMTREIAERVAREIADDLVKNGHIEARQLEDAVHDIVKCASHLWIGGYELAKELDDRCHWDCNLEIAEELDNFSGLVDSEITKAEKDWAERNSIQPPLPIGARVKFGSRSVHGEKTGEITNVYKFGAAKYLIKVDGDANSDAPHNSRRILNFEDVTGIETDTNADPDPASATALCLGG